MISDAKSYLKKRAPRLWQTARTTNRLLKLIPRVYGYAPRTCPICGHVGRFHAEIHFPDIFVFDSICPDCTSNSRNRLLRLALEREDLVNSQTKLLHFAPEGPVRRFLEPMAGEYRTADLFAQGVDLKLNIEAIDQSDAGWDIVVCSHVLEHVDHHKALAELYRILKPGGSLLALFPVVDSWPSDYENPEIKSEYDRGLHFGKENHLRRFGGSVRSDIRAAGFALREFAPVGPEVVEYGLIPGETLFIATRPRP